MISSILFSQNYYEKPIKLKDCEIEKKIARPRTQFFLIFKVTIFLSKQNSQQKKFSWWKPLPKLLKMLGLWFFFQFFFVKNRNIKKHEYRFKTYWRKKFRTTLTRPPVLVNQLFAAKKRTLLNYTPSMIISHVSPNGDC